MATILQQPDQYSFAGNLKEIIIATDNSIFFRIESQSEILIESSYYPDTNGRVVIDIRKIINDTLVSVFPDNGAIASRSLNLFSFSINHGPDNSFYAFEGGVDSDITSIWFSQNFLTWQPQTSYVTWSQPQYLSYISLQACSLKIKGYFKDGSVQTITFGAFSASKINTANLQYSTLPSRFADKQPMYIDVWVENLSAQRLSYIQRLVLKNSTSDDSCFIFKNTLGGWDSVVFTGSLKNEGTSEVKTFTQEELTNEYQVDLAEKFSKNTGYFLSEKHRIWVSEFFKTNERYFLSSHGLFERIAVTASSISSLRGNPSSYNFTFTLSRPTKYLNLPRSEEPEAPLELIDPQGELFFLAPRLSEFADADLDGEMLFPVQSPFSSFWKKISWSAIWNFLYSKLLTSVVGELAHSHSNLLVIGSLSESEGKLKYKGSDIGASVQIGETAQTAYRGDRGKIAYDHSQNKNLHFDNLLQKRELLSAVPVFIPGIVSGLFFSTTIPNIADTDYISIDISGFGRNTGNPFSWRGQTQITGGDFNTSAFRSVIIGQHLDVKICIHNAVVKVWVSGLGINANSNISSLAVNIRYGSENVNVIDGYDDMALPESEVVSLRSFLSFSAEYLRSLTTEEHIRLVKAVVSADNNSYQIWSGTPAEYAEIQNKDPYTIYLVQ